MGALKYIILLILPLNYLHAQQNIAIKINKTDSIQLKKYEENEFSLSIYDKKNIIYNKSKTKVKRVDGVIDCNGCKNESFTFIVKKIDKLDKKKQIICLTDFTNNKNLFFFSGYFIIEGKYYKNLGKVTN